MAFKDLQADLAELFDQSALEHDALIDFTLRRRAHNNSLKKARSADALLNARLLRKRRRTQAKHQLPPALPPAVQCVLCRGAFVSAQALATHYLKSHLQRLSGSVVSCRICRLAFDSERNLARRHFPQAHPLEHAASCSANMSLASLARKVHRGPPPSSSPRAAPPRLEPVRSKPGARSTVAHYRKFG